MKIGIIAPSSVVPKIELDLGRQALERAGHTVILHPNLFHEHFFYSETDEKRASGFLDFAFDDSIDAIWCARGGYGATHLLPLLDQATKKKKPNKKKILLGYSDATALLEFTRTRWGWRTLHAPMPALKTFSQLPDHEWSMLLSLLQKKPTHPTFQLSWMHQPKDFKETRAKVVGGNLSVWNSLLGTPYAGKAKGCFLIFEEIAENCARINRMIHHLEQTGGLKGVKALILGDFTDCRDTVPTVLKTPSAQLKNPAASNLMPLRVQHSDAAALQYVFEELAKRTGLPILSGLPLGHGDRHASIELGSAYNLSKYGKFFKA